MKNYTIESKKKKSRIPARLDLLQSLTGLILGLFIWIHILFDSSILFGKTAFSFVSRNLELAFLSDTGHGYPAAVFIAVLIIFTLFIIHAILGVRKIPISWKQHRIIMDQMQGMKHEDTNLWYIQALTGFILFFAGSAHLFIILLNPGSIDPYLSADRVVSDNLWALYLVLLVSVGLHACIGLYRLILKWDIFTGKNPREFRKKIRNIRNIAFAAFTGIGVIALIAFVIVGIGHKDHVGERYKPGAAHAAVSDAHADSGHASEEAAGHDSHDSGAADSHAASDAHSDSHAPAHDSHYDAEAAHDSHAVENTHAEDVHEAGYSHETEHDTGHEAEHDSHTDTAHDSHDNHAEEAHGNETDHTDHTPAHTEDHHAADTHDASHDEHDTAHDDHEAHDDSHADTHKDEHSPKTDSHTTKHP